jgi:DNA repair protein RadC
MHLGVSALSDVELVALALAGGTLGKAGQLAQELLDGCGGLRGLVRLEPDDLTSAHHIGATRAAQLCAAIELGRRCHRAPDARPLIDSPKDVYDYVAPMASAARECFRVLALNARRRLVRDAVVSYGSVDRCMVDPRDVFAPAVAARASYLVLVHNHPSGDPAPSEVDVALTRQLVAGAAVLGLRIIDHVVVAAEGYSSLSSLGLLPSVDPPAGALAAEGKQPPR